MAGITLSIAQTQLQLWLDCLTAIAKNQRYSIGDRMYERADLAAVKDQIEYWDGQVKALDTSLTSSGRSRRVRSLSPGW